MTVESVSQSIPKVLSERLELDENTFRELLQEKNYGELEFSPGRESILIEDVEIGEVVANKKLGEIYNLDGSLRKKGQPFSVSLLKFLGEAENITEGLKPRYRVYSFNTKEEYTVGPRCLFVKQLTQEEYKTMTEEQKQARKEAKAKKASTKDANKQKVNNGPSIFDLMIESLESGTKTTEELAKVIQSSPKCKATNLEQVKKSVQVRIHNLRKKGHEISRDKEKDTYTLTKKAS